MSRKDGVRPTDPRLLAPPPALLSVGEAGRRIPVQRCRWALKAGDSGTSLRPYLSNICAGRKAPVCTGRTQMARAPSKPSAAAFWNVVAKTQAPFTDSFLVDHT